VAAGVGLLSIAARRDERRLGPAVVGLALVARGTTGYCPVTALARQESPDPLPASALMDEIRASVTVESPIEDVYWFWKTAAELPEPMRHLAELTETDDDSASWGRVWFCEDPAGGTEVRVRVRRTLAAARWVTSPLARLLGHDAESRIREDLRRVKQYLEAGEVPMTAGQPHGHRRLWPRRR
jgi:uncharacterized membrane protein